MKSKYTRDVSHKLQVALSDGVFSPFVNFVRENKNKDLALCFRGNDSEIGTATIYRNNHMMWELTYNKDEKPIVKINPNHARFMDNWLKPDGEICKLMKLGFRDSENRDYDELVKANEFVKRIKNGKSYDADDLIYTCKNNEETKRMVEDSYTSLVKMQEAFFSLNYDDLFLVYNQKSKKYKLEKRPRNYIKQYFFDTHSDAYEVEEKPTFYSKFQPCVEKHVQQELFMNNHNFENGVFIYDSEFVQPSERVKVNNQPDMFGIRFDENGKMVSICMIEVKSTKSALTGESSLEKHLEGMEAYRNIPTEDGSIMDDRKKEACRILNQYKELNLYGVKRKYKENEFLELDTEIMFVFSHDAKIIKDNNRIIKGKHIDDVLNGFKPYKRLKTGSYTGGITVVYKKYEK